MEIRNRYKQILIINNDWCTKNHDALTDFFTKYFPAQARVIKADYPDYYFEVDELSLRIKWKLRPLGSVRYMTIVLIKLIQSSGIVINNNYRLPTPEVLETFLIEHKINDRIDKI